MDSIFGKYSHYKTPIHRMDPRVKIFGLILIMVVCFLPYGNLMNSLVILGVLSIVIFTIMAIARVRFIDFLKGLKVLWVMIIFLLIINLFIPYSSYTHPIVSFSNGYSIYWEGLLNTFMVSYRLVLMIALTMILTSTTTPMDITYGFEWYLTPLKLLKFPTQVVAMTLSLALRFIPTLLEQANRIMKAQKSRGVDYNRGFISRKIKSISTLIIPLLVNCFSISDDLSLAMEARGYDPYGKRSRYRVLKFKTVDCVGLIVMSIVAAFFIFVTVMVKGFDVNIIEFLFPGTIGVTF